MGSCLPSAGQVLIIRPSGKKGRRRNAPLGPLSSRSTCQEAQHSRAGSEQSRQNAVDAEVLENTFAKEQFPKRSRSHTDEKDSTFGCTWGNGRRGGTDEYCATCSGTTDPAGPR